MSLKRRERGKQPAERPGNRAAPRQRKAAATTLLEHTEWPERAEDLVDGRRPALEFFRQFGHRPARRWRGGQGSQHAALAVAAEQPIGDLVSGPLIAAV